MSDLTHKTCTKCKENKTIEAFSINRRNKSGLSSPCKMCVKEYHQSPKGKASISTASSKYAKTDKGRLAHRAGNKRWYDKKKEATA